MRRAIHMVRAVFALGAVAAAVTAQGTRPWRAEVALPNGSPSLGSQSTFGWDGAVDEPAPTFFAGDGTLQIALGGTQAGDFRLRRMGLHAGWSEVELHLLRDGDDCDLRRVHLRRMRGSDVLVCERDDQDGLSLRFCAGVALGALWLWCEAIEERAQPGEPLLVLPEVTEGAFAVECTPVSSGPATMGFAIRIGPPREAPTADLPREVAQVLHLASARLRTLATLQIDGTAIETCDFVRDGFAQLAACCDADGNLADEHGARLGTVARTGPLLSFLRFGHLTAARAQLEPDPVPEHAQALEALCWRIIHHYYYLRATLDPAPIQSHASQLADAAATIETALQTALPFPREALMVQALASMGALQDTLDRQAHPEAWRAGPPRARPGALWTERALQALHQMEARHWHAEARAFGPQGIHADALRPCASGYLLATGDRTEQHVRTVLALLGRDGERCVDFFTTTVTSPSTQIDCVHALTQFAARERSAALQRLVAMTNDAAAFVVGRQLDFDATGRAVDAALFALTGHRLAIGPGLDEDWLRLSPCLPDNLGRLTLRGLTQDGCCADLWLDGGVDTPPRCDAPEDPFAPAAIDVGQPWTRLTVRLQQAPVTGRRIVAQCQGQQLQTVLRAGDSFTHVLPNREPSAWLGIRGHTESASNGGW